METLVIAKPKKVIINRVKTDDKKVQTMVKLFKLYKKVTENQIF